MKALEMTLTIPPGTLWWQEFIASVTNDPAYADLITSHNTYLAYIDPSPSNNSPLKRRIVIDPENPLTQKHQFIMSDLPEGYSVEQAYIHFRRKMRDFTLAHNDAPYTETAEESFDGISRIIPKNLAVSVCNNYRSINGYQIVDTQIVDVE